MLCIYNFNSILVMTNYYIFSDQHLYSFKVEFFKKRYNYGVIPTKRNIIPAYVIFLSDELLFYYNVDNTIIYKYN